MRKPIGFAFVKREHSQGYFYLRDLFNGFRRNPLFIRMPYFILIVFLELKITDIQRFKVVVEVKARMRFV